MSIDEHPTELPMYPALSVMEKHCPPLRYGHAPYWRPPITPPSRDVIIPSWNWKSIHELPAGERALTLDVNGMYFSALGIVSIAHGNLLHSGECSYLPAPGAVAPGYYKITYPHWAFSGTIVSPLGNRETLDNAKTLWVAHPTLQLLLEQVEAATLSEFGIIESWTSATVTGFRAWQSRLRDVRKELLDNIRSVHPEHTPPDCECSRCATYEAFKQGYSAALSMMLTGEKCHTRRPDWTHAVQACAAAATWRKAWRLTLVSGTTLLGMGDTDEITIAESDLTRATGQTKPPFRFDNSGVMLGAFKVKKKKRTPVQDHRPAALLIDDEEDIL